MSKILVDPLGHLVVVPEEILANAIEKMDNSIILDSPDKVIQKPALLLSSCDISDNCPTSCCESHYFRMISWNTIMLISTRKENDKWIVYDFRINPSPEVMAPIYSKCKHIQETFQK
jgi:hypothetical protein